MSRSNTISRVVATAGTAVPLSATELWVSWFQLEFKSANSGANIYRACSSDVDNTYPAVTASKPYVWAIAGQNQNLADWFIDADTNGDGVWITYGVAQEGVLTDDI